MGGNMGETWGKHGDGPFVSVPMFSLIKLYDDRPLSPPLMCEKLPRQVFLPPG